MDNTINIQRDNIDRMYLKTTRMKKIYALLIAAVLIVMAVIWFCFMVFSVNSPGFGYPTQNSFRFYYAVEVSPFLNVGDEIWVGNMKGKITYKDDENFLTATSLENSENPYDKYFLKSKYYDENTVYQTGVAVFDSEVTGNNEYRMMWGRFTLLQMVQTSLGMTGNE